MLQIFTDERRLAAILLILSFIVFMVVGYMFTARVLWNQPHAQGMTYLRVERVLVIAAFLISVMGFVLLEGLLREAGDHVIARLALPIYLISAAVLVVAETTFLSNRTFNYPQIIAHVMLAFLAQAAFGFALLRTGLVAPWAGWATIIWNLALPVILIILSPRDIYYPAQHYIAPLLIGIALLLRR